MAGDTHGLESKQSFTESSKVIKVGKLQVVAIFDLVERLLQWNWNLLHDLTNMDVEYHEHIKFEAEQEKLKQGVNLNFGASRQPKVTLSTQAGSDMRSEAMSSFLQGPTLVQELGRESFFSNPSAAIQKTKDWFYNREQQLDVFDEEEENETSFRDIIQIIQESWNDDMLLQMDEINLTVPSDLKDQEASTLNISVGLDLNVKYATETKAVYDITNEDQPIKVEEELQKSDWVQNIQLKKLRLFMSGENLLEQNPDKVGR